jgi:hypothetical protein
MAPVNECEDDTGKIFPPMLKVNMPPPKLDARRQEAAPS